MKSNKLFVIAASLLLTFSFFAPKQSLFGVAAQQSVQSKSDSWIIEAAKSTVIKQDGKNIYSHEGSVEARLGEYRITSDRLKLHPADKKIIAEGNVVFTNKGQSINCDSVEFYYAAGKSKVILTF